MNKRRPLRSGYTTGACAAAAAKAGVALLLGIQRDKRVEIPFPDGGRVAFTVKRLSLRDGVALASVVKDAGDDPDVTNGAEIAAIVSAVHPKGRIVIKGGEGVGVVTRPGLPVKVGEPAINPVPRRMIEEAAKEAIEESGKDITVEIVISVPEGKKFARKTLNHRLGIVGGISILGTTGTVQPLSSEAWTATITSSMSVARAMGLKEPVLSAGRTSERAHMKKFDLPEPAYVLMGDYVEFGFREAAKYGFERISLAAQWAKMLKIAMGTPDTHVRSGVIDLEDAAAFLKSLGITLPEKKFNTAREMFEHIPSREDLLKICKKAASYGRSVSGIPVRAYLVSYKGDIIGSHE